MLSTTMGDTDPKVRRAAFWALGQLPGDAAQPALLKALEDPDPEIRARAARSLGGRRGAEPWPWPWPMPINR
jgi:HEAT repeat protein